MNKTRKFGKKNRNKTRSKKKNQNQIIQPSKTSIRISKTSIPSKTRQNKLKRIGGKMLASGGFGCVFRPALKCKGETERKSGKVSKLMSTKHAQDEFNEIKEMNDKLMGISNYQNYFLVDDFSLCEPAELDKEDLENFEKCHALSKDKSNKHLTINDINDNLDGLQILNMPFGGVPVDDYMNSKEDIHFINKLNEKLIDLLKNGIVPLNKNGIYHNDIKDSNVLVLVDEKEDMKTRLIDWGLSCSYKPTDPIPKSWENRPLQFNVPFSVILFTDMFEKSFKQFQHKHKSHSPSSELIDTFVKTYMDDWREKRGEGHISYITYIFKIIHNLKDEDAHQGETYIVKYLALIVSTILENKMTLTDYLNNVFIKIIDVWGFITVYFPLLDMLYKRLNNLTKMEEKIYTDLKDIFITYLYNPRITEININDLVKDLRKIHVPSNKK